MIYICDPVKNKLTADSSYCFVITSQLASKQDGVTSPSNLLLCYKLQRQLKDLSIYIGSLLLALMLASL